VSLASRTASSSVSKRSNAATGGHANVEFREGRLETHEQMAEKPNVTITFSDGRALVNFLFSPVRGYLNDFIADGDVDAQHSFDILTGMLKNELTVDGNLNYLYRFGFLANHLLLEAFRPLVIFS